MSSFVGHPFYPELVVCQAGGNYRLRRCGVPAAKVICPIDPPQFEPSAKTGIGKELRTGGGCRRHFQQRMA